MASEEAAMNAQLKPWTPRATNSIVDEAESPPTSEVTENSASAATNTRRWPSWSAARPPNMRKPANAIA